MAPRTIMTQEQARLAKESVGFCYLCGEPLPLYYINDGEFNTSDPAVNEDHVFAESMFAIGDRNFPLKLRVHKSCHSKHGENDTAMAELVKMFNEKAPTHNTDRLDIDFFVGEGGRATGSLVRNLWFPGIVFRWVQGAHAALYLEYLHRRQTKFTVLPPFHEIRDGQIVPVQRQYYEAAEKIIRNRLVHKVDRMSLYNGRCKYECVWLQQSAHAFVCCFALDINGWAVLSPTTAPRTCIGIYEIDHLPIGASTITSLSTGPYQVTLDLFPEERARQQCEDPSQQMPKSITRRGGAFPRNRPESLPPGILK